MLNIFCHLVQCWFKNGFTTYNLLKCVFAFLTCIVQLMHLGTVSNIVQLCMKSVKETYNVSMHYILYIHILYQFHTATKDCFVCNIRKQGCCMQVQLPSREGWGSQMLLFYLQNVNTCPVDRIKFNHIELLSCKSLKLIRKVWGILITRCMYNHVEVHCSWNYLNTPSHENVLHVCAKH